MVDLTANLSPEATDKLRDIIMRLKKKCCFYYYKSSSRRYSGERKVKETGKKEILELIIKLDVYGMKLLIMNFL